MHKLEHDIYQLDAHYGQAGVASIYLLRQAGEIAIIETGTAHSVPHILQALESLGCSAADVRYVIPTHIHLDHAGGAGSLMALCQNAQLLVHPRGAAHMINPEKLQAGTVAVYGEEKFHQLYGELLPVAESRVVAVEDEFRLDFNGRELHFLHTPGHAMHHFCIHDTLSAGIFTGDTFGLCYPNLKLQGDQPFLFATTTPVHFSPEDMLQSIDRLLAQQPRLMYLTHFGAIEPTDTLTAQLKDSVLAFRDIALHEQADPKGRQQRIEDAVMSWLLKQLGAAPGDASARWLANDVNLNAQGLEVWLRRQEKHAE